MHETTKEALARSHEKRVLVLGGTSMIGWAIIRREHASVIPVCNTYMRHPECHGWQRLQLEDAKALSKLLDVIEPDILLHCGGICDTDKCEAQPEYARRINVESISLLLRNLPAHIRLVYCSSDHVFGAGGQAHDEETQPRPVSEYGRTRVAAERLIQESRPDALITRSGLGIGASLTGRAGHLDWLRYRHTNNLAMTVVADEVRSAVWLDDLAERVWQLAHSGATGIHHITATRASSRPELARYLCQRYNIEAEIAIASRADQQTPHLGHVELATRRTGPLAKPLPAVVPLASLPL